jgi:MFS superfamily sulfate permease-like transporter
VAVGAVPGAAGMRLVIVFSNTIIIMAVTIIMTIIMTMIMGVVMGVVMSLRTAVVSGTAMLRAHRVGAQPPASRTTVRPVRLPAI